MSRKTTRKYVIYNKYNGKKNYYRQRTGIGPMFGGTHADALRFDTKMEAVRELGWHWGMVGSKVEEAHG